MDLPPGLGKLALQLSNAPSRPLCGREVIIGVVIVVVAAVKHILQVLATLAVGTAAPASVLLLLGVVVVVVAVLRQARVATHGGRHRAKTLDGITVVQIQIGRPRIRSLRWRRVSLPL